VTIRAHFPARMTGSSRKVALLALGPPRRARYAALQQFCFRARHDPTRPEFRVGS